jgi:hypothetical protein
VRHFLSFRQSSCQFHSARFRFTTIVFRIVWTTEASSRKRALENEINRPQGGAVNDYLVAAAYHSKGGSGLSRLLFCSFLLCFISIHLPDQETTVRMVKRLAKHADSHMGLQLLADELLPQEPEWECATPRSYARIEKWDGASGGN